MISYKKDTNNIVTISFDMDGNEANIINHEIGIAFLPVLDQLKIEKAKGLLNGVILTSSKSTFLASGELEYLYKLEDAEEIFNISEAMKKFLRELERPGIPVVAALNGDALGIGFEVALACHYRITINRPEIKLGLPDIRHGLIPSGGGIIRLMWLLGLEKAYEILINGEAFTPKAALENGLIDELASSERELIQKAKQWLLNHKNSCHPWDKQGYQIPGGSAYKPATALALKRLSATLAKQTLNNNPTQQAILDILFAGSKVDFDTACRIESRYFTQLVRSRACKNMIKAFWLDKLAIEKGTDRPKGYGKFRPKKVGIIGAGQMGIRIALACILAGQEVVIKDVSKLVAERGREYVQQKLNDLKSQNKLESSQVKKLIQKLGITDQSKDFQECDIIIEAVFENLMLKQKVTKEAEQNLDEYGIIGTNTLTIPISKLAQNTNHPENYVGLHFFHPADEVPLVEIVKGEKTSDETIARAFDFVRAIGKTPIVVKDEWGFFASRVKNTYILEGITLLQEGYPAAFIENLGKKAGMPVGALTLADDLGLKIVIQYERLAAERYGDKYIQHPAVQVLEKMINELDRKGKDHQGGFFDYPDRQDKQLWSELPLHFPPIHEKTQDKTEIIERFLFAQVIEAFWCLQEKVINSKAAANLGSILGCGFPAFKGGVIQYVEDYGPEEFIKKCNTFQKKYGRRFQVPRALLKEAAKKTV